MSGEIKYGLLPPRRPREIEVPTLPQVAATVVGITVVIALGTPWLVRAIHWFGPLYEAYAKWACQC